MPAHPRAHPFMPNSVPAIKAELMAALGIDSVDELFAQIPQDHRLDRPLELPPALTSEAALSRHMRSLLGRNRSCADNLSFLGGGCWHHYVPAVCDEIARRTEFLTPVWGTPSSDLGRNQAWFEFTSQLGELLDLELVALPVYSWGCAAGHAIRMASRLTDRRKILLPRYLDPERRAVIETYCEPAEMPSHLEIVEVNGDPETGRLSLDDLRTRLDGETAAIYFENPSYLGQIESDAAEIAALARRHGAETVVGVDPVSLGVLAPPAAYGADIVVGSIQPLGIHMYGGGGLGGFIASRDEPAYAHEYPALMVSIAETTHEEHIFSLALMHQCSYGSREAAKDWTGNSTYLYAIVAAAYMTLLGPEGFRELGSLIVQRSRYAASLLDGIDGITIRFRDGFFKEFVANFDDTGRTVAEINKTLLDRGIFGGIDLSARFPDLGQSALYCVTEVHEQQDLDRLAAALREVCTR
ncbi:MAG: aminomethyl-transferring glycine dehydrogenase subunit GcvPA [Gammaproteobacteria bacterium]|nr:aminomethyl-transferring glycine dehydrogenase subunit GcvPA [Gammaproteobacteria bacterium]MDH4254051.1 aminomethyl-transferring glycine dehydrogenase subunit GcvPA [Gammaproteobacteria bacterium]MDH5309526.1 aminomethyl-transferring glycine dehydrogenase subunit GcvPA [Gammaproteobacteria bacterium]